ncbi:MAG: site-2 protease family protein [Candidatus Verstraetearchaeota archaeon]|nr:site-2 protease family protein [Candidatus Verstraetearchaeota archaeon]
MSSAWTFYMAALLAFIVAWAIAYRHKDTLKNKGIEVYPLLLMWKTTAFNELLDRAGSKLKLLLKILALVAVSLGIGLMGFACLYLTKNLVALAWRTEEAQAITPILPGITVEFTPATLGYLAIAIALTLVLHELAHGLAAVAEGIKVKSAGILFLAIFPGGFVEVDEDTLSKASFKSRLKVYSAGSAANLATALIVLLLLANFGALIALAYNPEPSGVYIGGIVDGGPSQGILKPGDVILAIAGERVNNIADLWNKLSELKPGEATTMEILRGDQVLTASVVLGEHPLIKGRAFLGVKNLFPYFKPLHPWMPRDLPLHLYGAMRWLYIISLSVAIINMLPIPMLDGEKVAATLIERALKDEGRKRLALNIARAYAVMLLLGNLMLTAVVFPNISLLR